MKISTEECCSTVNRAGSFLKTLLSILCAVVFIPAITAAIWQDETTGVIWTYKITSSGSAIIGGGRLVRAVSSDTEGNIAVPQTLGGCTVKGIEQDAFYQCSKLKKVTIPSSVTYVGARAFYGCTSLEDVTIPSGVSVNWVAD